MKYKPTTKTNIILFVGFLIFYIVISQICNPDNNYNLLSSGWAFLLILLILFLILVGAALFGFFSKNQILSVLLGILLPIIPFYYCLTTEWTLWVIIILSGLSGWFFSKEEETDPDIRGFHYFFEFSIIFLLLIFIVKFFRIN
ncbi:hypothetical protein MsAg5_13320 [Methanosarcinaceae archaeon Ag5]|uniref:Uncharacterized protein n=1 Tax=Methanolapillus africanus TaxID=3028297 RepID=A0AAE4MKC0_9EURY|nr:hypothetical protein [Methanosarcinaceae archaeon Ag5]